MSRRFRRAARIVRREVGGEILLFDPRNDSLHVLNPTAGQVWDALDAACTLPELETSLRAGFEVEPGANVRGDIEKLLLDLEAQGLVEGFS